MPRHPHSHRHNTADPPFYYAATIVAPVVSGT